MGRQSNLIRIMSQELRIKVSTANERATHSFVFWLLGAMVLVCADQFLKYIAFHQSLLAHRALGVGWFAFKNYNFAFSIPLSAWLMYITYSIVIMALVRHLLRNWGMLNFYYRSAYVLLLSGALSNVVERVLLGYVRDFIYIWSGVFNLADLYILLGLGMLLYLESKNQMND